MAMLRGIETLALGRQRTVRLFYQKGGYVDARGERVAVADRTCYDCLNNYFALADDPIDFCPHCGHRDAPWPDLTAAQAWAQTHNFAWLQPFLLMPFAVRRPDGAWLLALAQDGTILLHLGRYMDVRPLQAG